MTCGMSAGQPNKRSRNPNLPDQYRSKKKPKSESSDSVVALKSHINLKWDESSKRVVPRKEQIGIPWSHLAPFVEPPRRRPPGPADVACVPREIFAFENLGGVLSDEGWDTCLTEAERNFLTQFLPTGTDSEEILHSLLTGENHHFGNPLLSWSSSLCYGNLHPDAVVNKEQQIRAHKKAYRAELNNYHSDMIEIVKNWKEKWLTCENEELFRDSVKQRQGDLRSSRENTILSKAPKNEMPMKVVRNGDFSKFMSYIKISKSQHDLVRKMKQSGDGIQTRHLACVIGDIDNFHVKPYETLMEDENERLRKHWAILLCKDLPAAFEDRRERKLMIENSRTSLCLEIAERNMSVVEKAEHVAGRTAKIEQEGSHQDGDISDGQEELVELSPEDVLQVRNSSSAVFEYQDVKDTSDTYTSNHSHDSPNTEDEDIKDTSDTDPSIRSHDSPNMEVQDATDMHNTNLTSQSPSSSDEQDKDLENISSRNSIDSGSSSGEQDIDDTNIEDRSRNEVSQSNIIPGLRDEDRNDTRYEDAIPKDHNVPDNEAREPKSTGHVFKPIQGLNSLDMLVQDFKNNSYTGLPIDGHGHLDERNDDLSSVSYPSASADHGMNGILLSSSNEKMNPMIVDQKEAESIAMIPSDSGLLFSKPSCKQGNVEEGLELKGPAGNCEKDLWQSASPVDSFYCPPGNGLYTQSSDLHLKHHLSGGPANLIALAEDGRLRQQTQVTVAAALPMGNAASIFHPCRDQRTNAQHQNSGNGIEMVPSYSVGHVNGIKQAVDLHSTTNGHLAQSGQVRDGLQEQMQLLDQSHNGLYLQELEKNLYSGAGLCTQETFPMGQQPNFAGHSPVDRNSSWFPGEHPSHDNWSGMGADGITCQDLPGGSSADGSLYSVLSQYKQASSGVQPGASSSSQSLGTRNLVPHAQDVVVPRAQNIVPPAPNFYGYTQSAANSTNNHVNGSVNNLQWANLAQGGHSHSHGMPDPSFRQFGGPWPR